MFYGQLCHAAAAAARSSGRKEETWNAVFNPPEQNNSQKKTVFHIITVVPTSLLMLLSSFLEYSKKKKKKNPQRDRLTVAGFIIISLPSPFAGDLFWWPLLTPLSCVCVCSGAFQIVWLCLQKTARRSLLLFYLRLWNEHSFSFLPSLDVQHKAIIFSLSCCWYVCYRCCCSTREYYIASYDPLWRLDNLLLSCTKSRFEDRPFTRHPPPAFVSSTHRIHFPLLIGAVVNRFT